MTTTAASRIVKQALYQTYLTVLLLACLVLSACVSMPQTDPVLEESIRWYTGETGTVDDVRAKALLEEATADNDPLSMMWLARVYSTGRMGYPAEYDLAQAIAEEVIPRIERFARRGHGEASFLMGTAYAEGLGKPIEEDTAVFWYRRAAELGHVLARHNLGNVYAAGRGVPQDDALAVQWWLLAAEAGDAIPQFQVARRYENGQGVERNLAQAIRWYREAAARGNANAIAALERLENSSP